MADPATALLAAGSGVLVGFLLALFGGGGSVLAAPLLIYLVGMQDPHVAIGTSALAVAATALFGLVRHWRAGMVKWPCAALFAGAGLSGSVAGSALAREVDGRQLLVWFAVGMGLIALSMFRQPKDTGNPAVSISWPLALRLAPAGLATGLAAGFFGIGGGFLIVPGLMLAAGMTLSHAAASSLVSVAVFGLGTSMGYASAGMVDWPVAGVLVAGGAVGTLAGLRFAGRLVRDPMTGRRMFASFILAAALYVGLRAAWGI
jgi:uncharacterized protein